MSTPGFVSHSSISFAQRCWVVFSFIMHAMAQGCGGNPASNPEVLEVACAASMTQPVSRLAERFEQLHGRRVQLQVGGTSILVNQAKIAGNFDLLITADQFSTQQLMDAELVAISVPLVRQTPVVVATKQASGLIKSIPDLFQSDLRIGLGDPQATSIGKATRKLMGNDANRLYRRAAVTRSTVTSLATDLKVGSIDSAIVWDSTASQFDLHVVKNVTLTQLSEVASACVMQSSTKQSVASQFAKFLSESEDAFQVYKECEFTACSQRPRNGQASE